MCVSMSGARSASFARGPGVRAANVATALVAEQATRARNARRPIPSPSGGQAALPLPVDALPPEAISRDVMPLLPLFPRRSLSTLLRTAILPGRAGDHKGLR